MNKNKISAEIIADSKDNRGHRITTFVLTFPRFILAELNTHRLFSRNSASSRAIPFEKMVKLVQEDPFVPIAYQENHKGMQGDSYLDPTTVAYLSASRTWLKARDYAVETAKLLNEPKMANVTKQLCNRLLEPFMWHKVILTATEFDNFFELRCPKYEHSTGFYKSKKDYKNRGYEDYSIPFDTEEATDLDWLSINKGQSEIHMMALAECMWDSLNESIPKELKEGEWHIPFGDELDSYKLKELFRINPNERFAKGHFESHLTQAKLEIATARCARVSYLNFEGKDDYEAHIKLYDSLLTSGHFSPFEHCARVMTDKEYVSYTQTVHHKPGTPLTDVSCGVREGQIINDFFMERQENYGWCRNFRGFIQLRELIK